MSSTSVPGVRRLIRAVPPARAMRPMIESFTPCLSSATAPMSNPGPLSFT